MESNINLTNLERKVFRSTYEDGLWDIFLGCIFSQFAIAPLLKLGDFWSSLVFLPVYLAVFILVALGKKYLVLPRAGMVKLGRHRKTKLKMVLLVMNVLILLGLITGLLFNAMATTTNQWLFPAGFSVLVLLGFSMAAYLLDVPRFYGYGALTGLAIPIGEILFRYYGASHHGFPVTFGICSGIIVITGIILFSRFLKKYPRRVANADLEGGSHGEN